MSDHAELAPSGAARWMTCTASIAYTRGFKGEDSEWNIEGSLAHEKLELWLSLGVPPTDGILYEHLEHAYLYALDLERRGYEVSYEKRVTYNEHIWGTVDILGIKRAKRKLAIADYKHGYRVVEAEGNAQMATYGICVEAETRISFDETAFTVIQPRQPHIDGPVRTWTPLNNSSQTFLEWHRIKVESAIREIYGDSPKFVAGRHCKFCPREGDCKTFANYVSNLVTGSALFAYFDGGETTVDDLL
jgi:hypothetical protein